MNQRMGNQTDEVINSSKFPIVSYNTSLNLAMRVMWMNQGMQTSYISTFFSFPWIPDHSRRRNLFLWKGCHSASHLHAVTESRTLCICTCWGPGFAYGGTKPRDSGQALVTPVWGSRHPTPRSSLHPSPTTVVCFLNKPRDRAMWGYKSVGNQMLTCK